MVVASCRGGVSQRLGQGNWSTELWAADKKTMSPSTQTRQMRTTFVDPRSLDRPENVPVQPDRGGGDPHMNPGCHGRGSELVQRW